MSDSSQPGGETPPNSEMPAAPAAAPAVSSDAAAPASAAGDPAPAGGAGAKRGLRRPRGFEWVVLAVAAIVAWKLWDWRGSVKGSGKDVEAPITLVTSDREDLACGLATAVGGYRCAFDANGKPWPNPPSAHDRLAPYYTTTREMYLIPGLFEQKALADRYASESPATVPRDKQRRFVARCRLRMVERVEHVKTRWLMGGAFNDSDGAWVAEPENCAVTNE